MDLHVFASFCLKPQRCLSWPRPTRRVHRALALCPSCRHMRNASRPPPDAQSRHRHTPCGITVRRPPTQALLKKNKLTTAEPDSWSESATTQTRGRRFYCWIVCSDSSCFLLVRAFGSCSLHSLPSATSLFGIVSRSLLPTAARVQRKLAHDPLSPA